MKQPLQDQFGDLDIYLFDQLLKGRFDECRDIIDIGCGAGRNIVYFLQQGFNVYGIDQDPAAVATVRQLSAALAPANNVENFATGMVEALPFPEASFDLAISSAVFHFAKDHDHFDKMVRSTWRVLRPGGYLFARLASDIGIERQISNRGNGRYMLPDGTARYLVNEAALLRYTRELNGTLYEPIKTTVVSNQRAMTTWCVRKN